MEDIFEIPVKYKGVEYSFHASIFNQGYTNKIQIEVLGEVLNFEPDEERNFRPVLTTEQLNRKVKIDLGLLKAITEVIEAAKRDKGQLG